MGNTVDDIYMPDLGEIITIRYGKEGGIGTVKGKVTKVCEENSPWVGFRLQGVEEDSGTWFVKADNSIQSLDVYRDLSDGRHRMNVVPGDVEVGEIHPS